MLEWFISITLTFSTVTGNTASQTVINLDKPYASSSACQGSVKEAVFSVAKDIYHKRIVIPVDLGADIDMNATCQPRMPA
ncbi:MAG: hypothetical protein JWM46_324 [Candidatus Kaiserbacteria bacterium]|nr:hypothetical protein [Candidatus Kaiserbacteria bacterium]